MGQVKRRDGRRCTVERGTAARVGGVPRAAHCTLLESVPPGYHLDMPPLTPGRAGRAEPKALAQRSTVTVPRRGPGVCNCVQFWN